MAPDYATIYEVSILIGEAGRTARSFRKPSKIKFLRERARSVRTLAAPLVSRESKFDLARRFSAAERIELGFPAAMSRRSPVVAIKTLRCGAAR